MTLSENRNPPSESTATRPKPHFVLCDRDKKAIARNWQLQAPDTAAIKAHKGPVGVIPGSVDCLVVDVDVDKNAGGPDVAGAGEVLYGVLGARPDGIGKTPSGGRHLWYRISPERAKKIGNRKWEAGGYHGDIRCDKGYIILWDKEGFKRV